ncbi:MAG TPA: ATP-binding protein [Syntrophorhabdaceae bacterium]|nr:ATP-binding protein [Syntrophorhabdaceae bacterium]HPC65664.1 ATP-binding protein [Syntrophorhabdaceae bacterium]HQE79744.1 ATP-binding protein [Syntrophorhabdaceae bacterium]HQH43476.1 ATP-binding protein [Syntrophorhabdaceae bacterium]HRR72362.1 ATP-binding protein [Syntrophorhabdaceae bacterium]
MNAVELLGEVIEISHSNLEINSRISAILNIIAHRMGFEEVLVFKLDKDKRITCRYSNQGCSLFSLLSKYRCRIGEGIIGSIAQKRIPQYFTYKDIPPRFGCIFFHELDGIIDRYRSFAFVPLSDDSYIYGVMVAISSEKGDLQDREKILLSVIAREIGGLIRVDEIMLSSKKRISELVTLSELGKVLTTNMEPEAALKNIVFIIAKALNATMATIKLNNFVSRFNIQRFTYGQSDPKLERFIEDLEGQAINAKRTTTLSEELYVDDEDISHYSLCSSPIITKNKAIGAMTICSSKKHITFDQNDNIAYLITTIANYISSGLENILLNTRLKDVIKELNETQKRVIEQEKLKSLGEMTANIAHEIKNPLVIIGGFTKRLAKKVNLSQTENRYANIIVNEVARLETILNEVLNYVKDTPISREPCNINMCIDEILYLFSSDASWEKVKIVKDYDTQLPQIICDIQQIKQVFINILVNSYEAMKGEGEITIKTGTAHINNKPYIKVAISDTGGGIDPMAIDNIFNPFFTTKEKGTGLGLAISNKIIMNNKGRIEVENNVGKGVTFFIYLPLENNL